LAINPLSSFVEVYSSVAGENLDLEGFLPADGSGNGAAVVFVHGGGWNSGARSQFSWHAQQFAELGYMTCSISYRSSTLAPFPAALEDCQAAVRWVRQNAERFGIQPDRIGAFGSSAGGHLVACLGVMEEVIDGISSRVNCVVDVHGVHDFPALLDDCGEVRECVEAFFHGSLEEKRSLAEAASPALHVTAETAPMLLTHDPGETTVPFAQTCRFADRLIAAGRPVQFMPTPESGHGFVYGASSSWTPPVMAAARAWFAQHLTRGQ